MSTIEKIEDKVAGWLKPVPHLPAGAQKWIANNVWWIVLVGTILSGLGLLIGLVGFLGVLALVGTTTSYYGAAVTGSVYGGGWVISALVSLAFTLGALILFARAVSPLKALKKQGWKLLFLVLLLDTVYVVLNSIFSFSIIGFIFGIIFGAIGIAIGAYFLFEIRSHFVSAKAAKK